MTEKKITIRKTCPACEGRGKSYGTRMCRYCRGNHQITETITLENVSESDAKGIVEQIAEMIQ